MHHRLFLAILVLLLPVMAARAADEPVQLMFVQTAENVKIDGDTLRLVNVGQQTLYFADRPVRLAGHLSTADFMTTWTAKAGPDNFGSNPPNATLSVYESGRDDNVLVVVVIRDPVVDGKDLVYRYTLVEGKMPSGGGASALFIDWIGVGGGVGFGYHGVGVGRRGPGFYR